MEEEIFKSTEQYLMVFKFLGMLLTIWRHLWSTDWKNFNPGLSESHEVYYQLSNTVKGALYAQYASYGLYLIAKFTCEKEEKYNTIAFAYFVSFVSGVVLVIGLSSQHALKGAEIGMVTAFVIIFLTDLYALWFYTDVVDHPIERHVPNRYGSIDM